MRGELKQYGSDPALPLVLTSLGLTSRTESINRKLWRSKMIIFLAASIKAKDIVAIVKRHPELAKDVDGLLLKSISSIIWVKQVRAFNRGGIGVVA